MKDLTVAICMYNAEKYIEETLRAVLAQTEKDFHLLIIDDCSTDHSVLVAKKVLDGEGREYILDCLPENQGIAHARQYALEHATTKYLVFVDSDDLPWPELVEKEYAAITADDDLIGVTSWSRYMDANSKLIKGGLLFGEKTKEEFISKAAKGKRIFLPIQTMFDRQEALRVGGFTLTGFPEGKPRYRDYCEDLDLWTRMSDLYAEGKAIVGLQEYLHSYRKIDGLSSNHFNMIIKMDYVKHNVKRRRAGLQNITFVDYMNSLDETYLTKLRCDSAAADDLRNGVFYMRKGKFLKGLKLICQSIMNRPLYIVDKLKHNF